jgi:hypothetical protein
MAKQRKNGWAVRIMLYKSEGGKRDQAFKGVGVDLLITEIFRYAGLVSIVEDTPDQLMFDMAPDMNCTEMWAQLNAARIRSFGILATPMHKYA